MKNISVVPQIYNKDSSKVFSSLRRCPNAIWLDSNHKDTHGARFDIISGFPTKIIEVQENKVFIFESSGSIKTEISDNPFIVIERFLKQLGPINSKYRHIQFTGGFMGFFGYDHGRHLHAIESISKKIVDLPEIRLGLYHWALIVDHDLKETNLIFHEDCPSLIKKDVLNIFKGPIQDMDIDGSFKLKSAFQPTISKSTYLKMVSQIKEYILAGDCYQTNISQHFHAQFEGDTLWAYLKLRSILPSTHAMYWSWDNKAILCLSPERYLKTSWDQSRSVINVETKPIKGTIERGRSKDEDKKKAITLVESTKDQAENLMIVDLLRNDISQNCKNDSVRVPKLFEIESFPNVHHLVSTVTGELEKKKSIVDLLRDSFPGGSITGAPKKRSMEIIDELEPVRRGVYCGSMGYISSNDNMDLNIAIRTVTASNSKLHIWGGGGITNDSDPNAEYNESITKVKILMDALESAKTS